MDRPVTEAGEGHPSAEQTWVVDAASPGLDDEAMARMGDPQLPDRLAWNTFRTLALWDSDAWVPSLLEIACGADNPLSPLDWSEASVVPGAANVGMADFAVVILDGPEAYVIVACTMVTEPAEEQLRSAMVAAVEGSLNGGRAAGAVVVVPPAAHDLDQRLERAGDVELHEGTRLNELLSGSVGWVAWPEMARLALDLAEEGEAGPAGADPDAEAPPGAQDGMSGPSEMVRRLVSHLQARFPADSL